MTPGDFELTEKTRFKRRVFFALLMLKN